MNVILYENKILVLRSNNYLGLTAEQQCEGYHGESRKQLVPGSLASQGGILIR